MRERERERERDAEQGDTSNSIKNRCFNDFEICESIRIVKDRIAIHMNRFLCAPLVFSSSSLKQCSMASPPLLLVPGGGVYLGLYQTREVTRCSPLPAVFVGIKLPEF